MRDMTLFEQLSDLIMILDADDFTLKAVRTGVSDENADPMWASLRTFEQLFQADPVYTRHKFIKNMNKARKGKPVRFDWKYCTEQGQVYWFDTVVQYNQTNTDQGQFTILFRDKTRKLRIDQALRTSEERYRALFDRSLFYVYVHDFEGRFLDVNDEALKALGYSRAELPGLSLETLIHPDDLFKAYQVSEQTLQHGKQLERQEYRIVRKDGTLFWIETDESLLYKDGEPYAIQGLAHDITERRRTMEELKLRYDFIHLSTQLSKNFINLPICDIVKKIHEALPEIVNFAQSDRCYVLEFSDDESSLTCIAEYAREGLALLTARDQIIPTAHLKPWLDSLRHFEISQITVNEDTPQAFVFSAALLRKTAVNSILQIPLSCRGKLIGVLGLATADQDTSWLEYHHNLLEMVSDIFANALDRLRMEKSLRMESERLNRIMEMSPSGIIITDTAGYIVYANPRAEQVLGINRTDVSKKFYDSAEWSISALSGGPFPRDELPFHKVMRTGKCFDNIRHSLSLPDGKQVLISVNAAPLLDPDGHITGVIATVEDITSQYRIETALRESETKFRNIVESSPLGIHQYMLDSQDRLVFCGSNPAADKILRLDNRKFYGLTLEEVLPGIETTDMPEKLHQTAKYGTPHYWSHNTYPDESGEQRTYEIHAFQTSPGKIVTIFSDITARKKVEDELKDYREHLEHIVRERTSALEQAQQALIEKEKMAIIGQLTATVSHEIRNPLGSIRASLFAINDAVERDEPHRIKRAVELAERNIIRCDRIISELLDFTRTKISNLRPTAIDDWLKDFMLEYVLTKDITLITEFETGSHVAIDSENLRRVMINIISNAVHSMNDPLASGHRLEIKTRLIDQTLEIVITDQGCGINPDIMQRIFEPLFSTKGFGVGLGLVIVKQIMEQHRGSIIIESEPGRGTTIRLVFPLIADEVTL
ncbi:PAS domain S-box protein [bacterium]|nr:PAS domain S-box protein [bacterium]